MQTAQLLGPIAMIGVPLLILLFIAVFISKQYKRCPSNKILVIYGKVGDGEAARCIHGGGSFVIPLLQDFTYLSLEPIPIEIDLRSALSKKNIRVNVPSTFTVGISTKQTIMMNAAERMLGLNRMEIANQAQDIILGQMRLVIATLAIEEINQDREKFLDLVNTNVNVELNKIGLDVINVNIRDITDESGYIEAIGKKAAAEAINLAKIEVAVQVKDGEIGQSSAMREQQVMVARQHAEAEMGQKEAEKNRRIAVSSYEAEGIAGEAKAMRLQQVATAQENALTDQGRKEAEKQKRVFLANQEAESIKGENESQAAMAEYDANLKERQAEAKRKGEVALANARRDVLKAEQAEELARLEKEKLVLEQIQKKQMEIAAEAKAEQTRRHARGEADAIFAKYEAEANGMQKVLEAKAMGYRELIKIMGDDKKLLPTLLMVEQMPELVASQVKAIQNLKIDKITVWDGGSNGNGEGGSTSNFLKSLVGSLPPMHELAKQAGVELPKYLGDVRTEEIDFEMLSAAKAEVPKPPTRKQALDPNL